MPEHPDDILHEARDALGAIAELIGRGGVESLHEVDPRNLAALIDVVRARMDRGGRCGCLPRQDLPAS